MKLTLHKSQVHSYSIMQWWACSSFMSPPLPAEAGCKVTSGLFYCWSLLRNNNMATNLQRFTLYCGSRRFAAWHCWTQTSWHVMQWDSDTLIAVSHVHLYFVKRSMSESVAMLPYVWKIHYQCEWDQRAWVSNYASAGFFSCSIKLRGLLEYIYACLWEYTLTVKV